MKNNFNKKSLNNKLFQELISKIKYAKFLPITDKLYKIIQIEGINIDLIDYDKGTKIIITPNKK